MAKHSKDFKFLLYAGVVFFCYFIFGMIQEKITRGRYGSEEGEQFTCTLALVLVQCVVNYLFAKLLMVSWEHEKDNTKPVYYFSSAMTYLLAMICSNMALQWVSYPTQVVGKAAKPIPVMILGVLIGRKVYPTKKYFFIFLIVLGVIMFMFKDHSSKTNSESTERGIGELLLILSLTMDGLTGAVQERIRSESSPTAYNMMLSTNYWCGVFGALVLVVTAHVTFQPLDNTSGILVLKQAKAYLQIDSWNLVCIYNITYLRDTLDNMYSVYETTKAHEKVTSIPETHLTNRNQIEHLAKTIEQKLQHLIPISHNKRQKRGLINGLGSVIKAITGNLDQDDAQNFERKIENLQNQVRINHSYQKETIGLAIKTIEEFEQQFKIIRNNQKSIVNALQKTSNSLSIIENQLHFLNSYVQIENGLQIIFEKLVMLENAITFAQLNTLHPSIINSANLLLELENIPKNVFTSLPFVINLENIHNIERSITVKAYSSNYAVTFILEIPMISTEHLDLLHLYSIPNKQHITIIPYSKYLLLGSTEYAYRDSACKKITEDTQICQHLETREIDRAEDCVIQLIQHRDPHNCTYARLNLRDGKIQKTMENSWLIIPNKGETAKIKCNNQIDYKHLSGPHLLTITNECKVELMDRELQTHNKEVFINENIPLFQKLTTQTTSTNINLKIEDISLDNLHNLINRAQDVQFQIDREATSTSTYVTIKPSWFSLILYMGIISTGIWYAVNLKIRRRREDAKSKDAPGIELPRFRLDEGRVTQ